MSKHRNKPDFFKWVEARIDCLPQKQVDAMQSDALAAVETWNDRKKEVLLDSDPVCSIELTPFRDRSGFCVCRNTNLGFPVQKTVQFFLNSSRDGISIDAVHTRSNQVNWSVTPFLDTNGDCRFKVNGVGSLQRWQVLRMALEPLLFPPRPR